MVKHVAQKVLGTLTIFHGTNVNVSDELDSLDVQLIEIAKEIYPKERKEIHEDYLRNFLSELKELHAELKTQMPDAIRDKASDLIDKAESFFHEQSGVNLDKPWSNELKDFVKKRIAAMRVRMKFVLPVKEINLKSPWRRVKYKDLIREKAGAGWFEISPAERRQRAHDLGAEITRDYADFEVTGAVFEKLIEPTLVQPTFVTHLPKELVPLAKISPEDPSCVEVFECCINGQEISPGYTEQNDPIEQRERLEHQAGGEQQKLDEDFLIALEHGMPPAGGIGIGIDRLCMMLLGQESIRDVILFPQLKPK